MLNEIEKLLQIYRDELSEITAFTAESKHTDEETLREVRKLNILITALEAQQADMWIPVTSGKLPEIGINVKLTWRVHDIFEHTNEDETEIAYRSVHYPYDWTLSRSNQRINVTAWKPLDEPWKEEQ
jgi:hypothetical protein